METQNNKENEDRLTSVGDDIFLAQESSSKSCDASIDMGSKVSDKRSRRVSLRLAVDQTRARAEKRRRESLGSVQSSASSQNKQPTSRKRQRISEASSCSISFSASFSSVSARRSVRPYYEPPSAKRYKFRRSGQPTTTKSKAEKSQKKEFCPISAAKKELVLAIERVESDSGAVGVETNNPQSSTTKRSFSKEDLELCLTVWDRIAAQPDKVEVVITNMALHMDLSARRLTRFLKGQHSLFRSEDASKISSKLRAWLQTPATTEGC